jgi:DNA mismatch repair protein MutS
VVELALEDGAFVANDVLLGAGTTTAYGPDDQSTSHAAFPTPNSPRVLLITGPNMAGKSTYLRQAALIVLLAQVGCFVPASRARIGLVDRIFTRVGAQDDLTAGASTFLVEMAETAAILRHATHRSLLVLDEIGRGTSTFDGLAIAQAVIEDVHDRIGARTLFATHFHELPALAERLHRIQNLNAAAVEENGRVVFLRRIVPGSADRSYGIHVARLAGLPEHVTARAAALLTRLENEARRSQHQEALPVPHITERHATFTPAQEECPTCATERAAHTMASLRSVNLAATTPIEALNLLFSLQETLTAAVPCRHRATGTRLAVVEPPHEPGAWWRGAGTSAPGTPS